MPACSTERFWPNEEVDVRVDQPPRWIPGAVVAPKGAGYLVRTATGVVREFAVHEIRRRRPELTLLPLESPP